VTALLGKVCVVTGASGGIGEASARALARGGATVVLAARRRERLEAIAEDIRGAGGEAVTVATCDVGDGGQVEALRDRVRSEHGRCDVLVNNAGIPGGGPFAETSLDQIERVNRVNFLGVLTCTKVFLPMLMASKGHVVNIASLAGRYALPGAAVYAATKHAVVAFSESLYHELATDGVMVTSVNPGIVATEGFFPEDSLLWKDPVVSRFVMRPEKVAEVVVSVVRDRKGPEVSVPRWLGGPQAFRVLTPPLYRAAVRRLVGSRARRSAPPPDDD
jgi:short-subunit dehydrogenase